MEPPLTGRGDRRSANLFVVNIVVIYALWKGFAYLVKHTNGKLHDTWMSVICYLGEAYASAASLILNLFGEKTMRYGISVFFPISIK